MMAEPNDNKPGTPRHIHLGPEEKKKSWLPWLLAALGLLALLFLLTRSCSREETQVAAPAAPVIADPAPVAAPPAQGVAAATPGTIDELGRYLEGTEATPRTFVLDTPNFDTGRSDLRPADEPVINQLAEVLTRYPNARVRVIGYADARGGETANAQLGQERAGMIKAALTAKGVDAGRIETASGGESDPVATNAEGAGQFANRRAEMVVLSR